MIILPKEGFTGYTIIIAEQRFLHIVPLGRFGQAVAQALYRPGFKLGLGELY